MKKLFLLCAIALIGLVSCERQALIDQEVPGLEPAAKVSLNLKVLADGEDAETKAVKSAWAEGDKLYLLFAQEGFATKEKVKKVILTYSAEGEWEVAEGQDALNEINGNGLVYGVYLAGGEFEWRVHSDNYISISPKYGSKITEAQKSDASEYTFSESTITATIKLQQVGAQISISNISGNNWIIRDETGYQELDAINSISFGFNTTISMSVSIGGNLTGREEDGKVVFYGVPKTPTRRVKFTISNGVHTYSKYFPEEKKIQVGKAINVKGPQINPDGRVINDNGWCWNENPVTSVITYTTVSGDKMGIPSTPEWQIEMFGAPVISHEYKGEGRIEFRGNVTKIEDNAFKGSSILQTMTIPEQVTTIGASAFEGCTKLVGVSIPSTVTHIGDYAFYKCWALSGTLTIPNGITAIGEGVFSTCTSITRVNLPEELLSIGASAFKQCFDLSSINLPEDLQSIGAYAFAQCEELDDISIPSTVSHIGDYAFYKCLALSGTLTIPNGITAIGEGVFSTCTSITRVNLPEGLLSIGANAFSFCEQLDGVSIPSTVTHIGDLAFNGCYALSGMTIPSGVIAIGEGVFAYTGITEIYLPERLQSIGNDAFACCQSLSSINLPDGLLSIGERAFAECGSLRSISIPSSVTSIGYQAFSSMPSLGVITFQPATPPTALDALVFYWSSNLGTIYVPAGSVEAYKAVLGSLAGNVRGF